MKIFTIEAETNNITVHATVQEAEAVVNAERFRNQAGLAKLAANWPGARLIEIWNSLPGAEKVKKFKDRNTAVERIWRATQSLSAVPSHAAQTEVAEADTSVPDGPQRPDVAPKGKASGKKATPAKKGPKSATRAKGSREGSKTSMVLDLLKRPGGVSSKELTEVTGWQAHSVRGFLSGAVGKKMGLTVVSTKAEDGSRTYSIKG